MYTIPAEVKVIPVGADDMKQQLHFDVYYGERLRYEGMSAAGVIDVIKELHDLHDANRREAHQ